MDKSSPSFTLKIRGVGHVPSFKNGKMMARGRLITHPEKQKWMEQAARIIESQLRSALLTDGTGTLTEPQAHSLILTSLPLDDSLVWIGFPCGDWQRVSKGDEGADITIEKL
jgi:hypothetical protein